MGIVEKYKQKQEETSTEKNTNISFLTAMYEFKVLYLDIFQD